MRVGLWAWALTLSSAAALFPIPDQGALKVFCFDLKCVQESLDTLKTHLGDPIVVGMLSFSLQEDSYLSVYLGRILDLFHFPDTLDSPALPVAVLILQNPPQANLIETAFVYLQMLPRRSVFVSMQHGPSVGMVELANFAKYGVSPRTVLHLNHEEPWETDRGSPNFVAEEGQLGELYRGFDLVLRNYYFAPLEGVGAGEGVGAEEGVGAGAGEGDTSTVASTFSGTSTGTSGNSSDPPAVGSAGSVSPFVGGSHFLSVGAPHYQFVIGNLSSPIFTASVSLASERGTLCHFRGRVDYSSYTHDEHPVVMKSDEFLAHAIERRGLLKLAEGGLMGGCDVSASETTQFSLRSAEYTQSYPDKYVQYTAQLADTVFALCPAGNNPETFRHYEALELGAIPVFLRPHEVERDFMLTGVWRDYPGPVLGTWEEYAAMAQGHDAASLDALQGRVREWYAAFRSQEKQGLKELLLAVMGSGNSGDSSNSAGLDSRSSGGGSGSGGTGIGIDGMLEDKGKGVGGADVGGAIAVDDKEPLRVLQPLRFGDITPGQYRENLQALLAMVLKQEARIRQLEGAIQTLTLQQHQ